jgi:hypothetical protein
MSLFGDAHEAHAKRPSIAFWISARVAFRVGQDRDSSATFFSTNFTYHRPLLQLSFGPFLNYPFPSSLYRHAHTLSRAPHEVTCGFCKPTQWPSPIPPSSPSSRVSLFFCTSLPSSSSRAFVYYGASPSSDCGGQAYVVSPMRLVKACASISAACDCLCIVLLSRGRHGLALSYPT